jgi:hypothetical protein
MDKVELCDNCGKNPASKPHTCPFQAEINDDEETLCNCCDECKQDCADDI